MNVAGGEAQVLVASAYGILDLFKRSEAELLSWSQSLGPKRSPGDLVPDWFAGGSAGALMRHLSDAGVVDDEGAIDAYRLSEFQQIVELLPHFRVEEVRRRPAPQAQVVFTVPPDVPLPPEAAHLRRSLATRVFDALVSASTRTLLASPFWSETGSRSLEDGLLRSLELGLPVTLAGAKEDSERSDLKAMLGLASRLQANGAEVRALKFVPPKPNSIFHAKIVAGTRGYLGSANLTAAGLGEHVEAGLPLNEVDVDRVWWLIGVLESTGLLSEQSI
jgi:hypothetical protein